MRELTVPTMQHTSTDRSKRHWSIMRMLHQRAKTHHALVHSSLLHRICWSLMTRTSWWDILQRLKRHPASSSVLPVVLASMDKALHCERYTPRPAYSMLLAAFKLQLLTGSHDASAQIVCQVSTITFAFPSFAEPKHCLAAHTSKACTATPAQLALHLAGWGLP